jgi:hypothetical protein
MLQLSRPKLLTWLQLASLITVITGAIAGLGSHPATDFAWLWLFDLLQWPIDGNPALFSSDAHAINAVLGGVMMGWGLLMFKLARDDLFQEPIRAAMQAALLFWFVTDSTGSFAADLPGNVVLNGAFLLLFLIPLRLLKRA